MIASQLSDNYLFDASPQPMWVVNPMTLRFLKINRAAIIQHGYSADEFLSLSLRDICSPCEFGEKTIVIDEFLSANPLHPKCITTIRLPHSRVVDVEITTTKINFEGSAANLCLVLDITEKKKSEEYLSFLSKTGVVLTESLDIETIIKAAAVLMLESLTDICIVDLYEEQRESERVFKRMLSIHRVLSKDKVAKELNRFPPKARSGDLVYESVLSRKSHFFKSLTAAVGSEPFSDPEYLKLLKSLECHSAIVVPLESHESVFGVISLIRTGSRPEFCDLDLDFVDEFSKRVVIAIENARLYQQAKDANLAKTQFIANISHEMRTPLGAIIGFTDILLSGSLNKAERRCYLEVIQRNGRQLNEVISELLDLGKIEAGKLDLELSEVSPREILEDVVSLLSIRTNQKELRFEIDISSDVPTKLILDQLKFKQILINIIGNAIKFSSIGTIRLRERNLRYGERKLLAIEVEDNGIGIDPENHAKLFHPFAQADNTMTRKFGGSGLGLFISRKLAQALGGDVELISSEIGKGSTFRITIAANEATSQPSIESTRPIQPQQVDVKKIPHPGGRVLVVDDSLDNQMLIKLLLKREALTVDFANDGVEAVKMGATNPYDLIMMDIQMPVMDGYAATVRLRELGVKTPIIALTAHALSEDRDRCLSVGCNGYITKPIDPSHFHDLVMSYI